MAFPEYLAQRDLQLASYLLGLLPEEETEQLDEASIADDEIAARLCAAENDLVDGYVAGTLDQNTRDRFEAFYLKSPRRRAKVKFARRFLTVVDRTTAISAPAAQMPVAGSDRIRRFVPRIETAPQPVRRRKLIWPLLTTAASVALACGLLVTNLQLRQRLDQAHTEVGALDGRTETLTKQLDEMHNENALRTEALEPARIGSGSESRPASAPTSGRLGSATDGTVLLPQTRDLEQPQTITLGPDAVGVPLALQLEANEFPQYRAVLKNSSDNGIVWRSAAVSARAGRSSVVPVLVPASVLNGSHYSLELAGIDAAGVQTIVNNYAFQIDTRADVR